MYINITKHSHFVLLLLFGLISCDSDGFLAKENYPIDHRLSEISWASSGCLQKTRIVGDTGTGSNTNVIKILKGDTESVIIVPVITYCGSEFLCSHENSRERLTIIVQNKSSFVARCICPYELSITLKEKIADDCTINVIMNIHSEINPVCTLTVDGQGNFIKSACSKYKEQ